MGAGGGLDGRPGSPGQGGSGPAGLLAFSHTRALTRQCATSHVSPAGYNRLDPKGLAVFPEVDQGCSLFPGPGGILSELENFSSPCPEQSGPGRLRANPTAHGEASNYQQRRSTHQPYRGNGEGDRRSPAAPTWGTWRAEGAAGPLGTHLPPSRYSQATGTRQPLRGPSISFHLSPGKPPEPQDVSPPLVAQRILRKPKVTHTFQLSRCHLMLSLLPKSQRAAGMRRQAGEVRGGMGGRRENTQASRIERFHNDDAPESQRDLGSLPQSRPSPCGKNTGSGIAQTFTFLLWHTAPCDLGEGRTLMSPSEPCSLHSTKQWPSTVPGAARESNDPRLFRALILNHPLPLCRHPEGKKHSPGTSLVDQWL